MARYQVERFSRDQIKIPQTMNDQRMNIKPDAWGRSLWSSLYYIAMGYPNHPSPEEKDAAMQFLLTLKHLIPCTSCRENFEKELIHYPPNAHLDNSKDFTAYINTLHNSVARRLEKPQHTVQEVIDDYMHNGMKHTASSHGCSYWHLVWIISLVALVSVVCTWAVTRKCQKQRIIFSSQ